MAIEIVEFSHFSHEKWWIFPSVDSLPEGSRLVPRCPEVWMNEGDDLYILYTYGDGSKPWYLL